MELFSTDLDPKRNILPKNGTVHYIGKIFSSEESNRYVDMLLRTIDWKHEEIKMFGKKITTKRKVAWYGDSGLEYTYSKTTKTAHPWTKELLEIKNTIEKTSGATYNSCLLNLYHSGAEGMGWHSDDEKDLKKHSTIASLSFGAARKFVFKHKKDKDTVSVILENGSLLLMEGVTQTHWLHRLPPTKKVDSLRINLTFRTIKTQ